ncbi:hypothetical protein VKT23_006519 [Stygiomarasmius scandens]|uniref:Peptidase C14 caspase domain-containing protein n=1 Tax=Marasmiellus scandens TaxID=2682957 RepID=A0ABR1JSP7_9AGAR
MIFTTIVSILNGFRKHLFRGRKNDSFFALIIGIDKYADSAIGNLHGAVTDAYKLKEFLLQIGIADDSIKVICDESATRACIEKEITTLSKSQHSILVYYAGYGATLSSNSFLTRGKSKIRILLSHDFYLDGSNGEGGIAIEQIISSFRKRKIVLVTDCCYSGYQLEDDQAGPGGSVRGIDLPENYTAARCWYSKQGLLSLIVNLFGQVVAILNSLLDRLFGRDLYAHVLLSACKDEEVVRESESHGVFTQELLSVLQENDITQITYEDLIQRLPHKGYSLSIAESLVVSEIAFRHCEGQNKSQVILDVASLKPPKTCSVRPSTTSGVYILSVGGAHGISTGAEVEVFADENLTQKLGDLVVSEAHALSSIAKKPLFHDSLDIVAPAYAVKRSDSKDGLRVLFDSDDSFLSHIRNYIQGSREYRDIVLVEDRSQLPDLSIKSIHDQVHFEITSQICGSIGFTATPLTVSADSDAVLSLLRGIAGFFWHIREPNRQAIIEQKVVFECRKLIEAEENSFRPRLIPDGNNLVHNDIIDVIVEETIYGFCITNKFSMELFCALFYFDMSDWSISE